MSAEHQSLGQAGVISEPHVPQLSPHGGPRMRRFLRRFLYQDSGEGVAEYALLIALIAICLVGIIQVMRNAVGRSLNTTTSSVAKSSTASYGSGARMRVISVPSYGGGGGGSAGPTVPDTGDEGDGETPADSLGVDSLGVSTGNW